MTQNEHSFIASLILIILYAVFLKRYFVTEKNRREWQKIVGRWF